ncbi:MAG TPA: YicC/YloC family endoribonuclease [Atribacteraceae bacterium]|nr:YicC/YloC family endoribonuclease [Atribacteraceae bacterium]
MNSMTGFGYAEGNGALGYYRINLKSLNHRFCDVHIRLPRELTLWEEAIVTFLRERISRGKVEIKISFEPHAEAFSVVPNSALARSYLEGIRMIANELDLPCEPSIELLLKVGEIIQLKKDDQRWLSEWDRFFPILEEAYQYFNAFRSNEGSRLLQDLAGLLGSVRRFTDSVSGYASTTKEHYRNRLVQRLEEMLPSTPVNEGLLAQELVYYVERSDIHEEIVRLRTHLDRMEGLFKKNHPLGRELDFILQELNREINTLGSKAGSVDISSLVIDMKTVLEKMREQIQNVE